VPGFGWRHGVALSLLLTLSVAAAAQEGRDSTTQKVWQALALHLPALKPEGIYPTQVPGLYEVVVGPRLLYVTEDARFAIQGDIIDLQAGRNLTQPRLQQAKAQAIAKVGEENMLIYGPAQAKHTITVFTDIDCGFCRKLHREMDQYNKVGIRVRYLFFPRAGVDSLSYRKAVSVWCAKDRHGAMTRAKNGEKLEELQCANPVRQHMQLGEMMGVTGTPAIVLENGKMLPGYVPADRLIKLLENAAKEK